MAFMYNDDDQWRNKIMEDFVMELRKNIDSNKKSDREPSLDKLRQLISLLALNPPESIKIEGISTTEGDVSFSVDRKAFGISFSNLKKYTSEMFSPFIVDFIGELLVREYINDFAEILTHIENDKYQSLVNSYGHCSFGMEFANDKFIFTFHVSLLQSILTEDFKAEIKKAIK